MGSSPRAHLAYGYNLGSDNRLDLRERVGDYGRDLAVDWWISYDPAGDDDQDVPETSAQIYRRLYGAIPGAPAVDYDFQRRQPAEDHYGVKLDYPGADGSTGYVLVAIGSVQSVDWDEVMTLDPADLATTRPAWDAKLAAALAVLCVTPIQDGPRWLVFPSYG
jgi:hypothetical protein